MGQNLFSILSASFINEIILLKMVWRNINLNENLLSAAKPTWEIQRLHLLGSLWTLKCYVFILRYGVLGTFSTLIHKYHQNYWLPVKWQTYIFALVNFANVAISSHFQCKIIIYNINKQRNYTFTMQIVQLSGVIKHTTVHNNFEIERNRSLFSQWHHANSRLLLFSIF